MDVDGAGDTFIMGKPSVPVVNGNWVCSLCDETKPIEMFVQDKARKNGYVRICKSCRQIRSQQWRTENPSKAKKASREYKRRLRYAEVGISEEGYQDLFKRQGGKCAICLKASKKRLSVDHDHKTGKVRGLLCTRCNQGLGYFKDDLKRLKGAISYLTGQVTLS